MKSLFVFALLFPAVAFSQETCEWDMVTTKNEILELKKRVAALEAKWDMVAAAGKAECPCPLGGKCICPNGNCPCPNCPIHSKVGVVVNNTEWKATKPTNKGRELLYFGASWCASCPAAIARLGGLTKQIVYVDCSTDDTLAKMFGVHAYPTLIAIDDGLKADGLHTEGNSVGSYLAAKWLGTSATAYQKPGTIRAFDTQTGNWIKPTTTAKAAPVKTYFAPMIHGSVGSGMHTHTCRNCGTAWSHGSASSGNQAAHTCPNCGRVEWGNITSGYSRSASLRTWTMPQNYFFQPRAYSFSGYSYGSCPNCPR